MHIEQTFTIAVTNTTAVVTTDTATKTWISFAADVQATATNLAGDPHTFTITATVNNGGVVSPVPAGSVVHFAWSGAVPAVPASSCITVLATGSCTVVVSSGVAGSGTITLTSDQETITEAVDVWMRRVFSVAGMRCTRCTPVS